MQMSVLAVKKEIIDILSSWPSKYLRFYLGLGKDSVIDIPTYAQKIVEHQTIIVHSDFPKWLAKSSLIYQITRQRDLFIDYSYYLTEASITKGRKQALMRQIADNLPPWEENIINDGNIWQILRSILIQHQPLTLYEQIAKIYNYVLPADDFILYFHGYTRNRLVWPKVNLNLPIMIDRRLTFTLEQFMSATVMEYRAVLQRYKLPTQQRSRIQFAQDLYRLLYNDGLLQCEHIELLQHKIYWYLYGKVDKGDWSISTLQGKKLSSTAIVLDYMTTPKHWNIEYNVLNEIYHTSHQREKSNLIQSEKMRTHLLNTASLPAHYANFSAYKLISWQQLQQIQAYRKIKEFKLNTIWNNAWSSSKFINLAPTVCKIYYLAQHGIFVYILDKSIDNYIDILLLLIKEYKAGYDNILSNFAHYRHLIVRDESCIVKRSQYLQAYNENLTQVFPVDFSQLLEIEQLHVALIWPLNSTQLKILANHYNMTRAQMNNLLEQIRNRCDYDVNTLHQLCKFISPQLRNILLAIGYYNWQVKCMSKYAMLSLFISGSDSAKMQCYVKMYERYLCYIHLTDDVFTSLANLYDMEYRAGNKDQIADAIMFRARNPLEDYIIYIRESTITQYIADIGMIPPDNVSNIRQYYLQNIFKYSQVLQANITNMPLVELMKLSDDDIHAYFEQLSDRSLIGLCGVRVPYDNRDELLHNLTLLCHWQGVFIPIAKLANCYNQRKESVMYEDFHTCPIVLAYGKLNDYVMWSIAELAVAFHDTDEGAFTFTRPDNIAESLAIPDVIRIRKLLLAYEQIIPAEYEADSQTILKKISTGIEQYNEVEIYKMQLIGLFKQLSSDEQGAVKKIIQDTFYLAMYMRKWRGPPNPYPLTENETLDHEYNPLNKVGEELLDINNMIAKLSSIALSFWQNLLTVKWEGGQLLITKLTVKLMLLQVDAGQRCIRQCSSILIATCYYYYQELWQESIADFNLSQVDYIQ